MAYLREVEAVLGERPTQAQIARRFDIKPPSARIFVQTLERKGLLEAKTTRR